MAELSTPWPCSLWLGAPILNAPMGGVAGGELASAVSRAGGLGVIGVGSAGSSVMPQPPCSLGTATDRNVDRVWARDVFPLVAPVGRPANPGCWLLDLPVHGMRLHITMGMEPVAAGDPI